MKRIICIILCIVLSLSCVISFAEELSINCSYDTYYESKRGRVSSYDTSETLLASAVYGRYSQIEFDISSLYDKEFVGAVLSLYVRTSAPKCTAAFYGGDDKIDMTEFISSVNLENAGKQKLEAAVSDYVKEAVKAGKKNISFFVKSETPISIFSNETSDKSMRPALRLCNEEPYIPGQMDFAYPTVDTEQLKKDTKFAVSKGHPYIMATKEDFARVREYAFGKNKYLTEIYANVKEKADTYLSQEPNPITEHEQMASYIGKGMRAWDLVSACALIYNVEGDARYAERAYEEAEYLCSLSGWGIYQYIDNNQTAFAVALCYDWLYDYLTTERKELLTASLKEKHLDKISEYFNDVNNPKYVGKMEDMYVGTANHTVIDNTMTFMQALAISDIDIDYSVNIMDKCFAFLEAPLVSLYPDGAWFEGVAYWQYVGPFVTRLIITMNKALGTSYGMDEINCFLNVADFPIYAASSRYNFIFGDIPYGEPRNTQDIKYNMGILKKDVSLQKYSLENDKLNSAFVCTDFDVSVDYDAVESIELKPDKYFRNLDVVTMRDTWDGNQEIFCGMLVQEHASHRGHMNSGTLAFEALGHQWITNPGSDNYNLPGYFGSSQNSTRWNYYFGRSEANNCLVINPNHEGGQNVYSDDVIDTFVSKSKGAYAISDLTETYETYAASYKRGIMLYDNRNKFAVQDELKLLAPQEVYSFINLNKCDIEILDNKTLVLTSGNKKVKVDIICDTEYEMSIMNCEPLPTSPQAEGNRIIRNMKRLAIHFPKISSMNLRVEFTPYLTEAELGEVSDTITPLSEWNIEDGEIEYDYAENILVDGKPLEGFKKANRWYEFDTLPESFELVADSDKYDITYTENEDKSAKYAIMKNKLTGSCNSYMLCLETPVRQPNIIDTTGFNEIKIKNATATSDDGNVPANVYDRDMNTRWSGDGRQSITVELEKEAQLKCIAIAWYSGNTRNAYFNLEVSSDGKTWTEVSKDNESCGTTTDYEYFDLAGSKAKYIRYNGFGTTESSWNSILEIMVYGK